MTINYTSIFLLLFLTQILSAQYQIGLIPRVSPDKSISQKIGYTEVKIEYGSPAMNNRQLWGDLVPYDKVWRAGANNATTVEFSDEIVIDKQSLDSSKYAFFIIPRKNAKWTVIFNKVHKQWGAFRYSESEDALRVDVIPIRKDYPTENLTYSIKQLGYQYGSLVLRWGYLEIEVPFETNYLKKFEQEVATRADQQDDYIKWIVYLQGAEHLYQIGSRGDLALSWINQAEKIMDSTTEWNDQFYPRDYVKGHVYWTKAKLLAKENNFSEAKVYGQKLKNLENTIFYKRKNQGEEIDALLDLWKEK